MTHDEHITELPERFVLTLVDTSSFLGSGTLTNPTAGTGTTDPSTGGTAPSASSGDLFAGAMSRLNDATTVAQSTGAGAQAANIDSPGSTTFASAP